MNFPAKIIFRLYFTKRGKRYMNCFSVIMIYDLRFMIYHRRINHKFLKFFQQAKISIFQVRFHLYRSIIRRGGREVTDPDTVVFLDMVDDPGLIQCLFKFCLTDIELPDLSCRHADHINRIAKIL